MMKFNPRLFLPRSVNEDSRRQELLLSVLLGISLLLCGTSIAMVCLRAVSLLDPTYAITRLPGLLGATGFFLALYFLARYGHLRLSASLFIAVYFFLGCYNIALWGILIPQALFLFILVIIMSSVLISSRFALLVTAAVGLYYIGFMSLETAEYLHPNIAWRLVPVKIYDSIFYSFNFLLIGIVCWLSNLEIDRSLDRARRSEAALKEERDQLEIKVEERTQDLERLQMEKVSQLYRFAELGKAASSIVHDLVNPLNSVTANLDQIEGGDQGKVLKRARAAARRMEQYIEETRRQIRNQRELTLFPVNRQISHAIKTIEERSAALGISIRYEKHPDLYLFGSPIRFQQLIINIVGNALDSYPASGPKQPITIRTFKDGSAIRVEIEDKGSGIPEEHMDKIFEALFSTKKEAGTGLGLSICKDIVERDFNGTIASTSSETGSVFTIIIPEHGEPNDH